jgi:hypothetical protein
MAIMEFYLVISEMQNSAVIVNTREKSKLIKDEYLKDPLAYNYSLSFQFALLAQATLETVGAYRSEVIEHFHDGNAVIVFIDDRLRLGSYMSTRIKVIGHKLGLSYPQGIEAKCFYPHSSYSSYH